MLDFHLSAMGWGWLPEQLAGLLFPGTLGMTSMTCNLYLKEAPVRTLTNDPEKYTLSTISQHPWVHVNTEHLLSQRRAPAELGQAIDFSSLSIWIFFFFSLLTYIDYKI